MRVSVNALCSVKSWQRFTMTSTCEVSSIDLLCQALGKHCVWLHLYTRWAVTISSRVNGFWYHPGLLSHVSPPWNSSSGHQTVISVSQYVCQSICRLCVSMFVSICVEVCVWSSVFLLISVSMYVSIMCVEVRVSSSVSKFLLIMCVNVCVIICVKVCVDYVCQSMFRLCVSEHMSIMCVKVCKSSFIIIYVIVGKQNLRLQIGLWNEWL